MTSYLLVKNYTDKKLEEYKGKGTPLSEQYARLTGMHEMNVVTLLDYIKVYYGEEAYKQALDRISLI